MKTIKVKEFEFFVDDDIYEEYKDLHFIVNLKRGKPLLQVYENRGTTSFAKFITNTNERTIFLDGNTLNLQRSNLTVNTIDRKRAKAREFYAKNREHYREYKRKFHQENKEVLCRKNKEWRENKREVLKAKRQTEEGKAKLKTQNRYPSAKYRYMKRQAKDRNIEFLLTKSEYFDILSKNTNCVYCGADVMLDTGGSLDRIDNDKGYNKDNVLVCCKDCNQLRGHRLTVEETHIAVKAVLEFRKNKR